MFSFPSMSFEVRLSSMNSMTSHASTSPADAPAAPLVDGERSGAPASIRQAVAVPEAATPLDQLVKIMATLRAPGGCAWDAEQTHASLVQYLIEEAHELVEAIESGSRDDLIEELGDVLYQVLFHADIAAATPEEGFDIQDVAAHMAEKMIGRHPHVFGTATAETADDVTASWDRLKASEKPHRTSVLDGIPQGMPALALADKLIGRAQKVGIEVSPADASDQAAAANVSLNPGAGTATAAGSEIRPESRTEPELGTLLLGIVAEARRDGLDAERALRTALRDLQDQVREVEQESQSQPSSEG